MKISIEKIADGLEKQYPFIVESTLFQALKKLGSLRTTKDIGLEWHIMSKDLEWEIEELTRSARKPTAAIKEEQPAQQAILTEAHAQAAQSAQSKQEVPEFIKKLVDGKVEN